MGNSSHNFNSSCHQIKSFVFIVVKDPHSSRTATSAAFLQFLEALDHFPSPTSRFTSSEKAGPNIIQADRTYLFFLSAKHHGNMILLFPHSVTLSLISLIPFWSFSIWTKTKSREASWFTSHLWRHFDVGQRSDQHCIEEEDSHGVLNVKGSRKISQLPRNPATPTIYG